MSVQPDRVVVLIACLMVGCGSYARADALFVARRGWHIDVGFALGALGPPLDSMDGEFPGAHNIFFGFGDRHYLMARHRGAPVMLSALWPGAGLILATGLNSAPAAAFGASQVVTLYVSRQSSLRAQTFIWNSMTEEQRAALRSRDEQAAPVGIPGPYEGSSFFESRRRYSALHTCNTWAAEVLVHAGLPVHSGGVIFAGQLWRRVTRLAARYRPTSDIDAGAGAGTVALVAGRLGPVLADDHGARITGHDDGGVFVGRRRTAAADAAGQQADGDAQPR